MCGIAGYVGNGDAAPVLLAMLQRLEYRGYDSAGIATFGDKEGGQLLQVYKKVGTIDQHDEKALKLTGRVGIGHTRWATHGEVSDRNAHPHTDCLHKIAVVHNGTIMNWEELKKELKLMGHKFLSDTDTEVIPHLMESRLLESVVPLLDGDFAIVALNTSGLAARDREVLAVRRGCPLLLTATVNGETLIASDPYALDVLSHGEVITLPENTVIRIKFPDTQTTAIRHRELPQAAKPKAEHYMLQEIEEQPTMLQQIVETVDAAHLTRVVIDLLRANQVVFTASGTSRYASLVGRYITSKGTQKLGQVIAASEFHYFTEGIDRNVAVVAVSQSGETADVLRGVRTAKERQARIIAVTNYPESSLGRIADRVVALNCGREIGVAASKTFTAQLAVFYLMLGAMLGRLDEVKKELLDMADAVQDTLLWNAETIDGIADKAKTERDFYYLGRGINFAVAGEAALKMKEISYIHAEGMAAGELKHGTLALVDKGTIVCGICPEDYTYSEVVVNLEEVRARGGRVLGISDKISNVFEKWIRIPPVPEIYYPLVCAIPTQMLAYRTAVKRGINPDMPKNLAKSVTVL